MSGEHYHRKDLSIINRRTSRCDVRYVFTGRRSRCSTDYRCCVIFAAEGTLATMESQRSIVPEAPDHTQRPLEVYTLSTYFEHVHLEFRLKGIKRSSRFIPRDTFYWETFSSLCYSHSPLLLRRTIPLKSLCHPPEEILRNRREQGIEGTLRDYTLA